MRKALLFFAAGLAIAGAAFASLGSVVASYPAPQNYPIALARATSPAYMWVFSTSYPYRIHRLHADTGSVYSSYNSPKGITTRGLTYEWGGYLHLGDRVTDYVYKCWYSTGQIMDSYRLYHELYGGLALQCDAGGQNPVAIFSDDLTPKTVWRQSHTTGSIYSSFVTPFRPYDLAWDYKNELLWAGDYDGDRVYAFNTNGSLVTGFQAPADHPLGLCYFGEYLWISTTVGSHYIWKVHCPADLDRGTNVTPTSAGKIKALFR